MNYLKFQPERDKDSIFQCSPEEASKYVCVTRLCRFSYFDRVYQHAVYTIRCLQRYIRSNNLIRVRNNISESKEIHFGHPSRAFLVNNFSLLYRTLLFKSADVSI